ncbi:hypothetical protein BV22DRAFT_1032296 [Leucogyrophana mollusca]|uniref:Uncharacterized protein n=1 Tax=Leucogyrophana mollusca TaxID=85980 RepID=A0ACB8BNQ3_9AGAM|nr:hypothetical protein BV22DRAFT_1032296 [Leucogyrophana mollusca]
MLSTRPLDVERRALTKTPGRALIKSRTALQENAVLHTTRPVSKLLPAHTPYAFAPKQQPLGDKTHIPGEKSRPATRPLGDKTPFPNRTNANHPEPRPSSTRKHPRAPRQSFETPVTAGHHWDVSDISIDAPAVGSGPIEEAAGEEDYGDVEYMPPKVLEIPYAPMFDLPDYKQVGRTMLALTRSYPVDDSPAPVVEFTETDVDFFAFEGLVLPELEDDSPFANFAPLSKLTSCVPSVARNVPRPATSATSANTMSRPATNRPSRPATGATSRPVISSTTRATPRPATSSTSRPAMSAASRPATSAASRPATSLARPTTSTTPRPPTVATARPATSAGTARPKHTLARPGSAMTARSVGTMATRAGSTVVARGANTTTARCVSVVTTVRGVGTTTLGTRGRGLGKQGVRRVQGEPATQNGTEAQGNEDDALVLGFSSVGFGGDGWEGEADFRFDI